MERKLVDWNMTQADRMTGESGLTVESGTVVSLPIVSNVTSLNCHVIISLRVVPSTAMKRDTCRHIIPV